MIWQCTKCGREVCTSNADEAFWERRYWRCIDCYTPVADGEFHGVRRAVFALTKNQQSLGDYIVARHIADYFRETSPETTAVVKGVDLRWTPELLRVRHKPDVIFWVGVVQSDAWKSPACVYIYPHAEARALMEMGYYPKPPWREVKVDGLPEEYVVIHARNAMKCPWKNMPADEFRSLAEASPLPVVVIGNDGCYPVEPKVVDLRWRLTLREIGYVLKRARAFAGRDSGIAHYAACYDLPMVVYGFESREWFPRARPGRARFFMADEEFEEVLRAWKSISSTSGVHGRTVGVSTPGSSSWAATFCGV